MSLGLENLKNRLSFNGGEVQIKRMNKDKLRSLKKALLYSYQSSIIELPDKRQFRALINPDKTEEKFYNKFISIPFYDTCLNKDNFNNFTEEELNTVNIKAGDVIKQISNNSYWLVYLQRLEETAYFRAELRKCSYTVNINNNEYKIYAARPSINEIDWQKSSITWNNLDMTLEVYITKNEETLKYLHRFEKIKINGKTWEIQSVDSISTEGIIIMIVKEYFSTVVEEDKEDPQLPVDPDSIYIDGPSVVYPYDKIKYFIKNGKNGMWVLDSHEDILKVLEKDDLSIELEILTGRSGNFTVIYRINEKDYILPVKIDSI